LTLRTENVELEGRLDRAPNEAAVVGILTDFNARVVAARRQLQGGPPVVTPTRDVGLEVALWGQRRDARGQAAQAERARQADLIAAMTWRERRRARRFGG
jgi:hypothetical protein